MTTLTLYAPGHYDPADSYGLIACQLARHLTAAGASVNAVGLGNTVMDSQPEDVRAVTSRPISPTLGGIVMGYPTDYAKQSPLLSMGPRVALTMFESTKLPREWARILNEMDAVIVPSWFCADVFRSSGVTVPLHVVPLGIGESYRYQPRTDNRPLTFLAFLDRGERKGGIVALQAFLRAFGEDMDYRLILKGRTPKVGFELTNPNIEVILQDMTEAELRDLYCRSDVLINPHKGEGFGLIPREFAATGGLSMTTGWSGTADGIDAWGYPLPYALEPAKWTGNKTLEGQELGQWAVLDADSVATKLQTVAAAWDWHKSTLAAKSRAAQELYTWRGFAEQVLNIYEGVAHGNRQPAAAIAA